MTDVRIRVMGGKAHSLGDVPFGELDSVIPFVKSWGVYAEEYLDTDCIAGQFVYEAQRAFFEVNIDD